MGLRAPWHLCPLVFFVRSAALCHISDALAARVQVPGDALGADWQSLSDNSGGIPGGQLDLRSFEQEPGHEPNPFDTSLQWSTASIAQRDDSARTSAPPAAHWLSLGRCAWLTLQPSALAVLGDRSASPPAAGVCRQCPAL